MSFTHFVVAKNKNFLDIPIAEFYFNDVDKMIKALEMLHDYEFEVNLFINEEGIDNEQLESVLLVNEKYKTVFLDKNEKIKYYKNKYEVKI